MPEGDAILARRSYRASVMFVDEQIGKILDALDARGLSNSTTVLFTADHGDGQGDHNLWRKGYPYELSSHVPFLLRWPSSRNRTPPGSRLSHLVELRDVFPTLLEAVGGDASPLNLDGKSLLSLLETGAGSVPLRKWRAVLDLEHSTCYNETNHWSALTDGELKFIFHAFSGEKQLFNLTADADEMHDLALTAENAELVAQWSARMVAQFVAEGRGEAWAKDGELQLRKLGQTYGPNYPGKEAAAVAPPPKIEIPRCPQTARASGFKVSDAQGDAKAKFETLVDICHDDVGFRLNRTAFAPKGVRASPWTTCNAQVWTKGEVLEFFAAPVSATARDSAPMWYVESDVGTRGALYVGLMNRTAGFNGPHGALDTCPKCTQ